MNKLGRPKKALPLLWGLCFIILIGTGAATPARGIQEERSEFSPDRWDLSKARTTEHLGRPALMGIATMKDVEFENGTIEVDIAVRPDVRTYPGIFFRAESLGNCERVYIRPHRAPFYPDALQYTPDINDLGSWQLFSGEGCTAAVPIPADQWLHLRVEVSGHQARVFFNDDTHPVLEIHELKSGIRKGEVGVYGYLDDNAYFSNFRIRTDENPVLEPAPAIERLPGTVTQWEISQPFELGRAELDEFPDDTLRQSIEWRNVACEPDGMVVVSRTARKPGAKPAFVYARTYIDSDSEQIKRYDFGYSDIVCVFIDGRILFTGNSAYQSRDPSFLGIIGYFDSVYLPLKKGRNELVLAVAEISGGWGFMVREGKASFADPGLNRLWEVRDGLLMPESAVYDPERNVVYVSNYDPYGVPGQQFVSKLSLGGAVEELKWVEGLVRPTGMVIHNGRLFVVERRNVAEIDIETGQIAARHPLPQPIFPNDITAAADGRLYVSDSGKGAVYRAAEGTFEEWIISPEFGGANGLLIMGQELIVGSGADHKVVAVDMETRKTRTVARFTDGVIDGLKPDGQGNLLLSIYSGRIYRIAPSGEMTKLLHDPEARCADFDFIPDKGLFVIPTLERGSVMALELKRP